MTASPLPRVTLVLGGARSGKSRYAESLALRASPPWGYIATAQAFDAEMHERIAVHRGRRDDRWQTVEAAIALPEAIGKSGGCGMVVIDCLTLWLSNVMLAQRDVDDDCRRLAAAVAEASCPLVLVSNEVGLGIVPDNALARRFRDAQGTLNQRVAALADRVVLMTAGLALTLKDEGDTRP